MFGVNILLNKARTTRITQYKPPKNSVLCSKMC